MAKCYIRPQFECRIRISSVKTRYSASIGMSKYDFEYHNAIIGPRSKVKTEDFKCHNAIVAPNMNVTIGFRNSKFDKRPYLNVKIGFRMSEFDIRSQFECQNNILHDKMRYSVQIE